MSFRRLTNGITPNLKFAGFVTCPDNLNRVLLNLLCVWIVSIRSSSQNLAQFFLLGAWEMTPGSGE